MKIIHSAREMLALSNSLHRKSLTLGFVPTMGALHQGHLSLIKKSKKENAKTVVSIFVNPLQFGPSEDFQRYPRPTAKDNAFCRDARVDFLYRPDVQDMYPSGFCTRVEVQGLSDRLCGEFRPGHFLGVTTVVLKLFVAIQPNRAYFGEKDYQQLVIIRRMVKDLNLPVNVIGCPTIRESDGLALSSRNAYLNPSERDYAPILHAALAAGAELGQKHRGSITRIHKTMARLVKNIPKVFIEYIEIVDSDSLLPTRRLRGKLRIVAAIRVGKTRLIDNVPLICKD